MSCCYGDQNCQPDDELMCDEHRGDHTANRADMLNDMD